MLVVGPTFYIVMKSDLSTLSLVNIISKYADDINLLVPQHCDILIKQQSLRISSAGLRAIK